MLKRLKFTRLRRIRFGDWELISSKYEHFDIVTEKILKMNPSDLFSNVVVTRSDSST